MSGFKKDKTILSQWEIFSREIFFSEDKIKKSFLIFALCLLLLVFRFLPQPDIIILLPFIFICLEFALVLILDRIYPKIRSSVQSHERIHLGPSEDLLHFYRYMIYTAIGLPCTVFMALTDEFRLSGTLRFLMILLFLISFSSRKSVILHICLFFSGFFFYAFLKTGADFFSNINIWEIAISYLVLSAVVLYLNKEIEFSMKKLLHKIKQKRSTQKHSTQKHSTQKHSIEENYL